MTFPTSKLCFADRARSCLIEPVTMKSFYRFAFSLCFASLISTVRADITVLTEHNSNDSATPAFKFKTVPAPSKTDAATRAAFSLVNGAQDENSGSLDKLHDGKSPAEEDQPAENFFFEAGSKGG